MSKTRQRVHGLPSCAFSRRARPRERESTFSEAGSSPPNPMPSTWMPSCLGQIVAAQAAPTGYAQVQASWWSHSHISLPSLLAVRNSLTLSSFTFHVRNNCYWMQSSNSTDLLMEMTCPSTLHLPDLGQVQPSTLNQWNQYPLEPWIFFFFWNQLLGAIITEETVKLRGQTPDPSPWLLSKPSWSDCFVTRARGFI